MSISTMGNEIAKEVYKPGDFIFFEGDLDTHFYIIESGQVQIFTKNKQGKRVDIIKVEEGESFGEFAMLSKAPRTASAQAITECSLVKVTDKGYEHLLTELPAWAATMLRSFAFRIANMNQVLQNVPQFVERTGKFNKEDYE